MSEIFYIVNAIRIKLHPNSFSSQKYKTHELYNI